MCDQLLTPTEREQFNVMQERLRAAYARENLSPTAREILAEHKAMLAEFAQHQAEDKLKAVTMDLEAMVEVGTNLIDRPRSAKEMIVGYCEVDRLARQALARLK